MTTYKFKPNLTVNVTINEPILFENNEKPIFFNITLESIYNIPNIMCTSNDVKVCVTLPIGNNIEPIVFQNGKIVEYIPKEQMKCWSGLPKIGEDANSTKYKISFDPNDIKNCVGADISPYLKEPTKRFEYNYLKRNYLLAEGKALTEFLIAKTKKLIIEVYMVQDKKKKATKQNHNTSFDKEPYLHMMAIMDVSKLLYPGVTSARVATQLRTYHAKEALELGGLEDSYFRPSPKVELLKVPDDKTPNTKTPTKATGKKEKKKKSPKGSKSSKSKASKSSKSTQSTKKEKPSKKDLELKKFLPPKPEPPPEIEPSIEVYNEDGKPCFIIMEFDFSEPLNPVKEVEEVQHELKQLLQTKPQDKKIVLGPCLSTNYFSVTVKEMVKDISQVFVAYMNKCDACKCFERAEFVEFLKRAGFYEEYLCRIIKAASTVINSNFPMKTQSGTQYYNSVGDVFVYLIEEVNREINKNTIMKVNASSVFKNVDRLLYYGLEALEMGDLPLAEIYFMARLCLDRKNSNYWFEFGLYNLAKEEPDKAIECVLEALSINENHDLSLVLYGILLCNEDKRQESETAFLAATQLTPFWMEVWGIFYLYYETTKKIEALDPILEKCQENLSRESPKKTFIHIEDLLWTFTVCPKNSIFLRTAALLIRMRCFEWAENAIAHELNAANYGAANYLLAVICYYKKNYQHAVQHLLEAQFSHGLNYAFGGLLGHCYFAMEKYNEAKEIYYGIIQSFSKPDDIHLIYVNCALIEEKLGFYAEARKLMLLGCKHNATPFTWYKVGYYYYMLNDFISAEECFSEANYLDNQYPEVWIYLALVNVKLNRIAEADFCYNQALKNDLQDGDLKSMYMKLRS